MSQACWFCRTRSAIASDSATVKMHGNVTHGGGLIRWNKLELSVPRCKECRLAHEKAGSAVAVGWLLGFIAALPIVVSIWNKLFPLGYGGPVLIPLSLRGLALYAIPFAIVAFPLGYGISLIGRSLFLKGTRREEDKNSHPAVTGKIAEGWVVGEKPKGAGWSGNGDSLAGHTGAPDAPRTNVYHVDAAGRVYVPRSPRDKVNWRALGLVTILALIISPLVPLACWILQSKSALEPAFLPFLSTWGSLTFGIIMLVGWIRVRSADYKRSQSWLEGNLPLK